MSWIERYYATVCDRLGVRPTDILRCGIERLADGRVVYRKPGPALGPNAPRRFRAIPIFAAKQRLDAFIGFLYDDGQIRVDPDLLDDRAEIGPERELPVFALFYVEHVSPNARRNLAFGRVHNEMLLRVQRPMIVRP